MNMTLAVRLRLTLAVCASLAATIATTGCSSNSNSSTTTTPPAVSVSVTPGTATLAAGQTQTFAATVANDGTATPGVTWSASAGTINSAGLYTAPSPVTTASGTITATSKTDGSKSATAIVTLTPIAVTVSPATVTLSASGTQTFTAAVTGDSVLNQGVTWSATAGTISSAGLYTAPASIPTNTSATITATSKTDTSKNNTATVTLQAPAPLSIGTASLPAATTTVAYSQALTASGGTAPYTWIVTAGSLPSGLNLSTAGVITGTTSNPITATVSFTVKVTDSTSASTTKALTIVTGPALTAGANNAELNGKYAFLVQGMYNGNGPTSSGKVYGETILGSLTLNGAGGVTSGSIDNYDARFNTSSSTVTGSYTLGSDNRGTIILNSGTRSFTFDIAAAGISGGFASRLKLVQFDDNNAAAPNQAVATGFAKIQTSSAFVALNNTYVFGMSGETACVGCSTVPPAPFGSVAMAGYFTVGGNGSIFGTADAHAFSANYNNLSLNGNIVLNTSPVNGRGTFTLSVSGTNFPTMPTHFVYYVIGPTELLIASTDAHNATSSASGMLAGTIQMQQTVYGPSTLSGNIIAYQANQSGGNGTTGYAQYSAADILEVQLTANSTTFSVLADVNDGNNTTPSLNQSITGLTYSLDNFGRLTVTGVSTPPIFYFSNVGTGYGVDQSLNGDGGLYFISPQTGAPFSIATQAGLTGVMVSSPPATGSQGSFVGIAVFSSPGGTISFTQDYVQAGTLTPGVTGSASYALDPTTGATTGRGTTANSVFYIVNGNETVVMDSTATGAPNVTLIENSTATTLPF